MIVNRFVFLLLNILLVHCLVAQKTVPLYKHLKFEECKASEYISTVTYIPLETNTECLLNEDIEIIATSQYLFVHDFKADVVFRFDIKGEFINKIGQKGQGPGEYKRLFGFYVDDISKKCFLLDSYSNRILVYDYEGKFIQQFSCSFAPSRMEKIGNNYILNNESYTDTKKELFLLDNNGKLLKQSDLKTNSRIGLSLFQPFFYKHNGHCYYKNYITDDVYHVDDKLIKNIAYQIECGNRAIDSKENQYNLEKGSLTENKIVVGAIKGYKNNLYITYATDKRCFAVYDIISGNVFSPGENEESGFAYSGDARSPFPVISVHSWFYQNDSGAKLIFFS